jgi:glutamate N-acetyltransferase/amino-acid N-acetyltransferase
MTVTTPLGFRAAGVAAGLKSSGKPDVALVVNEGPHFAAAGVFTSNRVKAAPVQWSQQVLLEGRLKAVVLNSGGANACTGPDGFGDTHITAEHVAAVLGVGPIEVAVCSTGLIGERLPMQKLLAGIDAAHAGLSSSGGLNAAQAIMTTDTHAKTAVANGVGYSVGGMAKGAGMLAPSLATMLVVITTDALVDATALDIVLREAVRTTFDRLDSDGCMSTNDTVLLLSSGAASVEPDVAEFQAAVTGVCADLAHQLLHDAEGASKDVRIDVVNAASEDDAVEVGRSVARNNLLKCALAGSDPNWGRVLAAVGTTSAEFDAMRLSVAMNGIWVCKNAAPGESRDLVDLSGRAVTITVDLAAGTQAATIYTNDLTSEYVHENSAYST